MPRGCRGLTDDEVAKILACDGSFTGRYALRDRALFITGITTGFRVSELLALRLKHIVDEKGEVVKQIRLEAASCKGGEAATAQPLVDSARTAIAAWLPRLRRWGYMTEDCFLFQSLAPGNRPLDRSYVCKILGRAFQAVGIEGKLGTHCMRKTFAQAIWKASNCDANATMLATRHSTPQALVRYLEHDRQKVDDMIHKRFAGL